MGQKRYISEEAGKVSIPTKAEEVRLDEFQNVKFTVFLTLQSVGVYPPLFPVNEPLLDNALEEFVPVPFTDKITPQLIVAIQNAKANVKAALNLDDDGVGVLYQMGELKVWEALMTKYAAVQKLWESVDTTGVVNRFEIGGIVYRFKDSIGDYSTREMLFIDNAVRHGWDAETIASDIFSWLLTSEDEDKIKYIEEDDTNIILNTELHNKRKTLFNALNITEARRIWFFFCKFKEISTMLLNQHSKIQMKYMAAIAGEVAPQERS